MADEGIRNISVKEREVAFDAVLRPRIGWHPNSYGGSILAVNSGEGLQIEVGLPMAD